MPVFALALDQIMGGTPFSSTAVIGAAHLVDNDRQPMLNLVPVIGVTDTDALVLVGTSRPSQALEKK